MKEYLRLLPPVHEIQKDERFETYLNLYELTREQMTKFIQQGVRDVREQMLKGRSSVELSTAKITDWVFEDLEKRVIQWKRERLTRVINGTGTVLHTNLGRARLSEQAIQHVTDVARNYSNLEYQIKEGKRGSRHDIIEDLLKQVTGAEAAMVVNNNAAAVFLILRALANTQEVIVSRGQLVEIGGSFRISSIMEESGAQLIEVGTTNKTHVYDYENAITESTAMIMKVHTSNFKTIGFTESVSTEELVALKKNQQHFLFYEDLGSGSLFDFEQRGIGDEPVVKNVIDQGVDLVSFSGDKLLGGPQAGIIVGKKEIINKLKKHQLARVLRVDKMTFAALEETLKSYLSERSVEQIPTIRDITRTLEEIKQQAFDFQQVLCSNTAIFRVHVEESTSQVGGGTMPGLELPTFIATIVHEQLSAHEVAAKLRAHTPPIISRIQDERVCIDFRTITEEEMPEIVHGLIQMQD
ncbi:L-seryl-tRNA(Sec) selenium transferase [Aquibacillus sp. 3ASR75-11]|uniref:L-seryl-tRNA(Sec) selenium transferase n=1 Tax=Terrihalobacillus insolitus TaxID=2950438 RepID=A0A9X4AN51_9BACI|nr:L-seryl-tRNA(Sec) selenium transferase [Terrihalobacillus insolitus]MDC3414539.1 L-seryl-tRNA(Sec) selenium transferase [Terrihalobacillus insolitus]MDC3426127.1 L-seryl-tRNA(Sec) selenium transferase [Terrihalobacillus insolitus]